MRFILIVPCCALALLAVSCGEKKTADTEPQAALSAPQQSAAAPAKGNSSHAPAAQAAAASSDIPAPPRDAQLTIVCKVDPSPGHVERMTQLKSELIKSTSMKGWYVSHDESKSSLFYGYYTGIDDPKLKADRARIVAFQTTAGEHPFVDALPVSINTPDPTAPPEFNLVNAKGFWSLQIAAYQGVGRKDAAVESVKEARKLGVEAYYYHGPNSSVVCIGAWPQSAIRKQEMDGGSGVDVMDRDRPLLFLGGASAELPQSVKDQYSKGLIDKDSGKQVEVVDQKVEILDPTMRAAMETYPTHALNGLEEITQVRDPATGQMQNIPKRSVLVEIPQKDSILTDTGPAPTLINPAAAPQPIGGKLRSVGQ
jgi:hypothetical protein